jgi:hypothetical protein
VSLIPSNINDAIKKDAEDSNKPRRESGEYQVEVTSVAIADNPTTWIEKALMVEAKFLDEIGGTHKVRIELSPCTARDGGLSPGKIKFLRWQLGALGLDADEIAFQLFGIIGNRYKGRYTVDDGLNEDGSLKRPGANLNPHTGKPYINRDLIFLEKLESDKQDADAEAPDAEASDEGAS